MDYWSCLVHLARVGETNEPLWHTPQCRCQNDNYIIQNCTWDAIDVFAIQKAFILIIAAAFVVRIEHWLNS